MYTIITFGIQRSWKRHIRPLKERERPGDRYGRGNLVKKKKKNTIQQCCTNVPLENESDPKIGQLARYMDDIQNI